jgi:N-acetylglucosamine repressor
LSYNYYRKGTNLEDVQEINRSLVLRLIRRFKVCSRATIAEETGLQQATISKIVSDLIGWGFLKEVGIIEGKKGRRSIGVTLNIEKYKVIGVRLTRNYYTISLFDLFGNPYNISDIKINILDGSKIALESIEKSINKIIEERTEDKIIGIGVAIPGPFLRSEGRIGLMSEFSGWENINLEEELKSISNLPVYIEHDANAGALAEWLAKPKHKMVGTMIYIAAGQGIGAGIIIDGKLFRGSLGIVGEIGHMSINYDGIQCECGLKGCLEQYCSTIAIVRQARNNLKNNPGSILNEDCTLEDISDAVSKNDKYAKEIFEKAAWYLSIGIANVVNCFNPDVIVLGDELIRFGPGLLDYLRSTVKKLILPAIYKELTIELSTFKNDPALIGAGELVIDNILHTPSIISKLL